MLQGASSGNTGLPPEYRNDEVETPNPREVKIPSILTEGKIE